MSSALTGDYLTMAEACGEVEPKPRGWVPYEDFDPDDPEEMETMRLVWENERYDSMRRLEAENARLRERIAELEGDDGDESIDDEYPFA